MGRQVRDLGQGSSCMVLDPTGSRFTRVAEECYNGQGVDTSKILPRGPTALGKLSPKRKIKTKVLA